MKFWRQRKDEALDAEIRHHLNEAIRDRVERGEAPDEARANALREFGNVGLVKEVTREMWGWATLERMGQDLQFGLRMLRKHPSFSLIAILTLALSIGANLAIFSFVDTFFLRPLPAHEPERLINVDGGFAYPAYAHYRNHSKSFETLAAHYSTALINLVIDDAPRPWHQNGT